MTALLDKKGRGGVFPLFLAFFRLLPAMLDQIDRAQHDMRPPFALFSLQIV
jgi:hypothetical protein